MLPHSTRPSPSPAEQVSAVEDEPSDAVHRGHVLQTKMDAQLDKVSTVELK